MILTGQEIQRRLHGDIDIDPFVPSRLNPNSYNLTLAEELIVYEDTLLDMKQRNEGVSMRIPPEGLVIRPGRLYLGRTAEYTRTDNLVPMLEGRSSVGRLGISVHATAGFGDTGFEGYWTLEISCVLPVRIYPHVEICQIYYHTVEGEITPYRNGKYQRNHGIQVSMLYRDFGKSSSADR